MVFSLGVKEDVLGYIFPDWGGFKDYSWGGESSPI